MSNITRLSLKKKLMIAFLAILIIPSFVIGYLSFESAKTQIKTEQLNNAVSSIQLLNENISGAIDPRIFEATYLAKNLSLQLESSEIHRTLADYLALHPQAAIAYVGTTEGKMIRQPYYEYPDTYDPRERVWYQEAMAADGPIITAPYIASSSGELVITIAHKLADGSGVFGMDMSIETLKEIANSVTIGKHGFVTLLDTKEFYISKPDTESATQATESYLKAIYKESLGTIEENGELIAFTTNDTTGWKIIGTILEEEVSEAALPIFQNLLIVIAIAIIVGTILVLVIIRSITRPIQQLRDSALKVSEGDLTGRIAAQTNDEIGQLAVAFDDMKNNLKTILSQVEGSSALVGQAANILTASTAQVIGATEQTSQAIADIALSAEEQKSNNEENAASLDVVAQHVLAIADNTNDVSALSQQAMAQAEVGGESVQRAVTQMSQIQQSVSATDQAVRDLYDRTKEINAILDVIQGIADQTNLLALNASIEAARAGEHGKGFAVVADEVRKLAEDSKNSTGKIGQLIKDIQSNTAHSVEMMQSTLTDVEKGMVVSNESATQFAQILSSMQEIAPTITDISSTTQDIAARVQQVSASAEQLTGKAKTNARSTEDVAASSEEVLASMEEMAASAESLQSMSQELQQAISHFKMK